MAIKCCGNTVSLPPGLVLTATDADSFAGTSGQPLTTDPNWATIGPDPSTVYGTSGLNEAVGVVAAGHSSNVRTLPFPPDQFATVNVGTLPPLDNAHGVGLIVRGTRATGTSYYGFVVGGATGAIGLFRNDGANTFVQLVGLTNCANPPAAGDNMLLVAEGNRITFTINQAGGSTTITATDSTYDSGAPGIDILGDLSVAENFEAGTAMTVQPPAPTVTDTFTRANGNMSTGQPGWTTLAGTVFTGLVSIDPTILSDELNAGTVHGVVHNCAVRNDVGNGDTFCGIDVGSQPLGTIDTVGFIGMLLRMNNGGGAMNSGYLLCAFGPHADYEIYRLDNGVSTLIAATFNNGVFDPTGTAYTAVVVGDRLSFNVAGKEVMSAFDGTYPVGVPGVMLFPSCTADVYTAGVCL